MGSNGGFERQKNQLFFVAEFKPVNWRAVSKRLDLGQPAYMGNFCWKNMFRAVPMWLQGHWNVRHRQFETSSVGRREQENTYKTRGRVLRPWAKMISECCWNWLPTLPTSHTRFSHILKRWKTGKRREDRRSPFPYLLPAVCRVQLFQALSGKVHSPIVKCIKRGCSRPGSQLSEVGAQSENRHVTGEIKPPNLW